jgi:hypothetical protein
MNIDITKKYTTRNGLPVRIYAGDGAGGHPIHGAIKFEGGWSHNTWCADGAYTAGETFDSRSLIPVKTWRAWKRGEGPKFFIAKRKLTGELSVAEHTQTAVPRVWLDHYLWVHEDGAETPCGVEE